jgi:sugar/nucleoside kinase (ribokinase family)
MIKCLAASCAIGASMLLPHAAASQEGMDFDTLAACSIIYQQVSNIYSDKGDVAKHQEFSDTAMAYSASALHMLGYQADYEQAAHAADGRMHVVTEALNTSSRNNPNGDMGVIEEWLPYCDSLSGSIEQVLIAREARGW